MKPLVTLLIAIQAISFIWLYSLQNTHRFGSTTAPTTNASDTLDTLRQNYNSLANSWNNDKVSTTTAYTWTALQSFFSNASSTQIGANQAYIGGTATTTITSGGKIGIASSTPFGNLGIGSATATSTISGGYFCAYFRDTTGRGLWITLATSTNAAFATSTAPCNI